MKEKDDWKRYKDLTFSLNAPGGHLPDSLGMGVLGVFLLSRRDL
ncbi:hypothetical protein [Aerosakkonema funiforme]